MKIGVLNIVLAVFNLICGSDLRATLYRRPIGSKDISIHMMTLPSFGIVMISARLH